MHFSGFVADVIRQGSLGEKDGMVVGGVFSMKLAVPL